MTLYQQITVWVIETWAVVHAEHKRDGTLYTAEDGTRKISIIPMIPSTVGIIPAAMCKPGTVLCSITILPAQEGTLGMPNNIFRGKIESLEQLQLIWRLTAPN